MSEELDKRSLSERDICTKYITPGIVGTGWHVQTQVALFRKWQIKQESKCYLDLLCQASHRFCVVPTVAQKLS